LLKLERLKAIGYSMTRNEVDPKEDKKMFKLSPSRTSKLAKEALPPKVNFNFEINEARLIPSNIFLLTHKCGNNYVQNVFRLSENKLIQFQTDEMRGQMPGPYIGDGINLLGGFENIRCRNFTSLSIEKLLRSIDLRETRFFLFVRHPASLFRSAVSYHIRGGEKWATKNRYSYLNNRTLTQALNEAKDLEARLIITMTHFGILWRLTDNWLNCYHYLTLLGANLTLIKTEDVFSDGDDYYFQSLSEKMSHDGFSISSDHLKAASPKYMDKLPPHSTGEFKKDPLDGYTGKSLEMYNQYFLQCEQFFYAD